ncbi:MAG: hypothetical protein NC541_11000 [bacterium]|nr:hypothetical protein [bacterium]
MKKKDTFIQDGGDDQLMNTENSGEKAVPDNRAAVSGGNPEDTAGGDKDQDADNGEGNREESGGDADDSEASEPEIPKILTAIYPILYLSHQYKPGEKLPTNDSGMVEAWIAAGTAAWLPVREPAVKAKPRTAEPGLPGQVAVSEAEDGENLVGRIPKTAVRKG